MVNVGKVSIPVPWILWVTVFRAYLAVFQNPPVTPSEVLEDYGVNEKKSVGDLTSSVVVKFFSLVFQSYLLRFGV